MLPFTICPKSTPLQFLYLLYHLKDCNMSHIRNIHFSIPCKENINDMSSCDQGKHCNACERTIIDFRNKSQEELDKLKKTNKQICGIYSEKQVAKGYESYFQLAAATVRAIGLSGSFQSIHAQEETDPFKFPTTNTNTVVCTTVSNENLIIGTIYDEYPEYPGGIKAMRCFFEENLVYPSDSVEGKVYVSLVVDTIGRVTNVIIKKSLSPLADAEVVRVIKLMIFKPARINGKAVNSKISLPVSFSLDRKK